jgi:WD40 repeat protein
LRRTLYASQINLAQAAWEAGNVGRVLDLLKKEQPKQGEPELRGFEWHFWNNLCHAALRSTLLAGGQNAVLQPLHRTAITPDGSRVAAMLTVAGRPDTFLKVWDTATGKELFTTALVRRWPTARPALSPDGRRLALAEVSSRGNLDEPAGGHLRVWDVATGKELLTLGGPAGPQGPLNVRDVLAFSSDGTRLAVGVGVEANRFLTATQVKVLDLATGRELAVMQGENRPVKDVTFSPDGTRVAASVTARDARGLQVDAELWVWDAATGQKLREIHRSRAVLESLVFSPDGARLAWCETPHLGKDPPQRRVWDLNTNTEVLAFAGVHGILLFSPDGGRLATWGWGDSVVSLRDAATGEVVGELKGHPDRLVAATFSPDGRTLTTVGSAGRVSVWDTPPRPESPALPRFSHVVLSPDPTRLAVYLNMTIYVRTSPTLDRGNGEISILDPTGREVRRLRGHTAQVAGFRFSPDGRHAASADEQGGFKIWEVGPGRVVREWQEPPPAQGTRNRLDAMLLFSADGRRLLVHGRSGAAKVVSVADGRVLLTLDGQASPAAFSPDGTRVAALHRTTEKFGSVPELKVWDVDAGREVFRHAGEVVYASHVVFGPDGKRLAAVTATPNRGAAFAPASGSRLKVWDVRTGEFLLEAETGGPTAGPAFSPDGTRLALGEYTPADDSAEVRVWDLAGRREAFRLQGHAGKLAQLAFSPDSSRLASAAVRETARPGRKGLGEVKLWDAGTGRELLNLSWDAPGEARNATLAFSPDGHRLALAEAPRSGVMRTPLSFRVWDATPRIPAKGK